MNTGGPAEINMVFRRKILQLTTPIQLKFASWVLFINTSIKLEGQQPSVHLISGLKHPVFLAFRVKRALFVFQDTKLYTHRSGKTVTCFRFSQ